MDGAGAAAYAPAMHASPPTPAACDSLPPLVAAFVAAAAVMCLATFAWILACAVWDDVQARRGRSL